MLITWPAKFKEGVKATVDEGDSATHYDLGVAYKEMGLFADAIFELKLAGKDPARTCTCYATIAHIHRQNGDLVEATEALEQSLLAEDKTEEQHKGLLYELALLFEELGNDQGYRQRLAELGRKDSGYRDVAKRLQQLGIGTRPSSDPPDDDLEAAFDHLLG